MSTEDNLEKTLKRVESAMCGFVDAEWLRNLFKVKDAIIKQLTNSVSGYAEQLAEKLAENDRLKAKIISLEKDLYAALRELND